MITIKIRWPKWYGIILSLFPFFNELHLDYCCGGEFPGRSGKGNQSGCRKVVANLNDYLAKHSTKTGSQQESLNGLKSLSIPTCSRTWKRRTMSVNGITWQKSKGT